MYPEIKRRIEERIKRQSRLKIERIAIGKEYDDRDIALISAHVTTTLEQRMRAMYDDKDAAEAAAQPRDVVRDFGGLLTRHQMEKHLVEQFGLDTAKPLKTLDFTVQTGSRFFGTPYDLDWSVGDGVAISARVDGNVFTIPKDNAFSAAGIGFYLTTDEPVLAAITPQGTYDYNWFSPKDLPFARSSGGMGLTVYTNSEPKPTMSSQVILWSTSGMTMLSGQKGSGRIADASSPTLGFGPVPLAPALVNMVPGPRYLVWVWCWQTTSQLEDHNGFWASMGFSMPFVTVAAIPPIALH